MHVPHIFLEGIVPDSKWKTPEKLRMLLDYFEHFF